MDDLLNDAASDAFNAHTDSLQYGEHSCTRYPLRTRRGALSDTEDAYHAIAHIQPDLIETGQYVARVARGYVQV